MPSQYEKALGCLLGHLFADALGATFEGLPPEQLHERFSSSSAAFDYAIARVGLRYTDDGQMMLALAEYLTKHETIEPTELMRCFVEVYEPDLPREKLEDGASFIDYVQDLASRLSAQN